MLQVDIYWSAMTGATMEGNDGERPGLFHSVALRPYHDNIHFMIDLHFSHVMVGAQCNGVE